MSLIFLLFPIFEPTKHSVGSDRDLEIRLDAVHIAQEKELRDETLSKLTIKNILQNIKENNQ